MVPPVVIVFLQRRTQLGGFLFEKNRGVRVRNELKEAVNERHDADESGRVRTESSSASSTNFYMICSLYVQRQKSMERPASVNAACERTVCWPHQETRRFFVMSYIGPVSIYGNIKALEGINKYSSVLYKEIYAFAK